MKISQSVLDSEREPLESGRFVDAAIFAIASSVQLLNSLKYYPLLRYLQFVPTWPMHGVEKGPAGSQHTPKVHVDEYDKTLREVYNFNAESTP